MDRVSGALELVARSFDRMQASSDLCLGKRSVGGQIEKVLFLGVQGSQLSGELTLEERGGSDGVVEGLIHVRTDSRRELGREADGVRIGHRLRLADRGRGPAGTPFPATATAGDACETKHCAGTRTADSRM